WVNTAARRRNALERIAGFDPETSFARGLELCAEQRAEPVLVQKNHRHALAHRRRMRVFPPPPYSSKKPIWDGLFVLEMHVELLERSAKHPFGKPLGEAPALDLAAGRLRKGGSLHWNHIRRGNPQRRADPLANGCSDTRPRFNARFLRYK